MIKRILPDSVEGVRDRLLGTGLRLSQGPLCVGCRLERWILRRKSLRSSKELAVRHVKPKIERDNNIPICCHMLSQCVVMCCLQHHKVNPWGTQKQCRTWHVWRDGGFSLQAGRPWMPWPF